VWGICLKSYEKESFLKSFVLFFLVQLFFLMVVMWQFYKSVEHKYDMKLMNEMTQCSYTLECPKYEIGLMEDLSNRELNIFYKSNEYYMLFSIPTVKGYYLKLSFSKKEYGKNHQKILISVVKKSFLYSLFLLLVSAFFAHFALRPLRDALNLNDEFVKDMLHDFNTPLSSLQINFKILQKKFGQDEAIYRSEEAMKSIHDLQSNLVYFLSHSPLSQEKIELSSFITKRVKSHKIVFPEINFLVELDECYLTINPEAFVRVIDNLLSNASKYNVINGTVKVALEKSNLVIEDSGIGIKNPSKIFNRFYRETSRGMGIGLHVVKKLCDDLNIKIDVESEVKKGTKIVLNLEKVMLN